MANEIRLHEGAKFQYIAGVYEELYTATVENIAIVTDGKLTETKIYFSNDHSKNGQELYCMTPEEFCNQLAGVNALQIS